MSQFKKPCIVDNQLLPPPFFASAIVYIDTIVRVFKNIKNSQNSTDKNNQTNLKWILKNHEHTLQQNNIQRDDK